LSPLLATVDRYRNSDLGTAPFCDIRPRLGKLTRACTLLDFRTGPCKGFLEIERGRHKYAGGNARSP
jgi:hypothetical protein